MNAKLDRIRVLESAEKLIKGGKLREAAAEYEKLAESDPSDIGVLNTIGDLYVRIGHESRAIEAYQRVAAEYEKRGLYSQALAIHKKVFRMKPDDPEIALNLADLYGRQGFVSDAKDTFAKAAERFLRNNKVPAAVSAYEKSARIDREDIPVREKLAALYKKEGRIEAAVEMFADIAEKHLENGFADKAEKVLLEARGMLPSSLRIITDLMEVYKRKNDRIKAVQILEQGLKADENNPQLLNLLGNLHFEDGDFKRAEKAFSDILESNPMNVNSRIKLGRLAILRGNPDRAFDFFEPLVNNLVKKNREEQAVGLLGLILADQRIYLPALEKLASIYRASRDFDRLEIVDRTILGELSKEPPTEKTLAVLEELIQIRPEDEDLAEAYHKTKQDIGRTEEEEAAEPEPVPPPEKDSLLIESTLSQADIYIKQGLVRNARRILETLKMTYPRDTRIAEKLELLDQAQTQLDEQEILNRVHETTSIDAGIQEARRRVSAPVPETDSVEEKVGAMEVFSDISEIVPLDGRGAETQAYFDLTQRLDDELRLIQAVRDRQTKGLTIQFEKDLSQIVDDFRKDVKAKVPEEDAEVRFQLGVAFMELGLIAEAVDEFLLAARDKERAMESYHALSRCHRKNKNFPEAEQCLTRAMKLTREGTDVYHALEFDLAGLMEESKNPDKALWIYRKIRDWNPTFRNVSTKIKRLEKTP
ncbi:MAG: tetratricopeptide repeat protein [Acidobacteriota bacterium]|nr:tetratricopeptide repeat protein [Acidobacteriota bacterium]